MSVQAPIREGGTDKDAKNARGCADSKPTINIFLGNNTIIGGNLNGNFSQSQVRISESTVGSLEVSSNLPTLLPPVTGTSFFCDPGKFGGETALVSTLLHILASMNFSYECQQEVLALMKNLARRTGQDGSAVKPTEKCSTEFMSKLNEITSKDDIKPLVKEGFEALIQINIEAKPARDFITTYEDEEISISSKFYEGRQRLRNLQDLSWEEIYYRLASETCEQYRGGGVGVARTLACIVAKLTNKLPLQTQIQRAVVSTGLRDHEVFIIGREYVSDKNFVHAIIAFSAAAKLAKQNPDPEYAVRKIQLYLHHIRLTVENNVEKPSKYPPVKAVVIEIVIPIMHGVIDCLRTLEGACRKLKVEKETWCLGCVSACYALCAEFGRSIDEINCALAIMDREFRGKAETYRVYGMCINNKGSAFQAMGDAKNAAVAYKTALKAYEKVTDWQNETEERDTVAKAKKNLQQLRK